MEGRRTRYSYLNEVKAVAALTMVGVMSDGRRKCVVRSLNSETSSQVCVYAPVRDHRRTST